MAPSRFNRSCNSDIAASAAARDSISSCNFAASSSARRCSSEAAISAWRNSSLSFCRRASSSARSLAIRDSSSSLRRCSSCCSFKRFSSASLRKRSSSSIRRRSCWRRLRSFSASCSNCLARCAAINSASWTASLDWIISLRLRRVSTIANFRSISCFVLPKLGAPVLCLRPSADIPGRMFNLASLLTKMYHTPTMKPPPNADMVTMVTGSMMLAMSN